jgi:hypothetical protein
MNGQLHVPAVYHKGSIHQYPFDKRLGGPWGRFNSVEYGNISYQYREPNLSRPAP